MPILFFTAGNDSFAKDGLIGLPALLDYGSNVFTGPSALVDPVSGNTYLFSIMQDQRTGAEEGGSGWAHCVGLPRRIWLSDDGTDVKMAPIDTLANLEGEILAQGAGLSVEAFFNESRAISIRSYSEFDSQAISLEADGEVVITELYAAEMNSIY